MSALVVAMDGPSGTGKSSVSRRLASALEASYLDTGAMYRVATVWVLRSGVEPTDADAVAKVVAALPLEIGKDPLSETVLLDGEDVSGEIRGDAVTKAVSAVSAVPAVRELLVQMQRDLASSSTRIVVEGRDIGTVVLPDADVKVFLTASPEARAERRNKQNIEQGRGDDYESVLADVQRRDHADSTRAVSPLRPAEDSVIVDTSELDLDGVIERLLLVVNDRSGAVQ
ncbi:cytidylate kinase [Rhodococcoides fascians]|jgi:cytidylate kinase|uniref:(d)CMP kinase n=1 Tax=Nocardiaceae TaxID=85025 RepID=UPI00050CFCDF|nr:MULTISPECIES: (d)CMP kinase [Rhodococcus]AMY55412.1 Cytidylate kinase [Rhodococcus fascians D188]KQU27740.1 cytidylate kinase [Rhodococcus sp. Leaf233]MBY4226756.1 (d)CMP kinase [Rhodococcus fascians]OZE32672.1 cytidylate kinase [Rhodococcus sp. 05-2254-5]OZE48545.1 cytidylate kinase [Rhodococcus sp. 05-2254-1]